MSKNVLIPQKTKKWREIKIQMKVKHTRNRPEEREEEACLDGGRDEDEEGGSISLYIYI